MSSGNQGRQNSILLDDDVARWFFSQSNTSYQKLINNVLHNHIVLCKHISYYSEVSNEEKAAIYSYLLDNINSDKVYSSKRGHKKSKRFVFSQIKFNYPMFMSILTILIVFAASIFEVNTVSSFIYIVIAVVFTTVFLVDVIQGRIKSDKQTVQEKFLRMQEEAEENLEIIIKIRNTAKPETLKSIEQDFEYENKKIQVTANFLNKMAPIVAILIAILFVNSLNVNNKEIGSNLLYGIFQGLPGLVAVIALIMSIYTETLTKSQYEVNNRCLYVLKVAQITT